MGKLTILIGLPRCGKSTWARKHSSTNNAIVLSGDDFRLAITGQRFCLNSELHVRANLITAAKALLVNNNVIVDETNTTYYNQRQLLDLTPNPDIVLWHTPKELCIERAKDCNQYDLIPSIERMNDNLRIMREGLLSGSWDERINKDTTTEIGPILYHIFTEDPYR